MGGIILLEIFAAIVHLLPGANDPPPENFGIPDVRKCFLILDLLTRAWTIILLLVLKLCQVSFRQTGVRLSYIKFDFERYLASGPCGLHPSNPSNVPSHESHNGHRYTWLMLFESGDRPSKCHV